MPHLCIPSEKKKRIIHCLRGFLSSFILTHTAISGRFSRFQVRCWIATLFCTLCTLFGCQNHSSVSSPKPQHDKFQPCCSQLTDGFTGMDNISLPEASKLPPLSPSCLNHCRLVARTPTLMDYFTRRPSRSTLIGLLPVCMSSHQLDWWCPLHTVLLAVPTRSSNLFIKFRDDNCEGSHQIDYRSELRWGEPLRLLVQRRQSLLQCWQDPREIRGTPLRTVGASTSSTRWGR